MNGTGVTQEQLDALAAFVKSIKPPESPYDLFVAGDPTALSVEAVMGMDIFFGRGTCATCHTPPLFTNNTLQKNQINATLGSKSDTGALFVGTGPRLFFSVPQLRGVRSTAPYMHNGALGNLEQVVRFYNKSFALNLTNQEVHYVVEFLRAL
jgi:cytochrome c peroxidase